jgi:predicted O-methyltransferase YrrM
VTPTTRRRDARDPIGGHGVPARHAVATYRSIYAAPMATGRSGGRGGGGAGPSGLRDTPHALRSVRRNPSRGGERPTGSGAPDVPEDERAVDLTVAPPTPEAPEDLSTAPEPERTRAHERAETWVAEDEILAAIRARSAAAGVVPLGPGAATALTFLAAATRARAAVEIGTGLGVGTVSLLRGMPHDGLLTSIDIDSEHQRAAREACVEAGFAPSRLRMITGRALQVLPRLSDAGYDLVVIDAVTTEYPRYLAEAMRLLRPGGVVVLDNVLWNGRVADPVRREAVSGALRETTRAVREDERLLPLMLPLSDGLLCAARR